MMIWKVVRKFEGNLEKSLAYLDSKDASAKVECLKVVPESATKYFIDATKSIPTDFRIEKLPLKFGTSA